MAFMWSKALEIGDSQIDEQHKELVNVTNGLLDACVNAKGEEGLLNAIGFLAEYAVKHFSAEEVLQQRVKYPGFADHKKLHDGFKATVADAMGQIKEKGVNILLITKTTTLVGNWLISHIKNEDLKIAPYLKN